jgi:hypothetical protein
MADYSVSMDGSNSFYVSVERTIVADRLSDLSDVSATDLGNKDQYVLVYDASQQKYKLVNPDVVLNAAVSTETNQPGLVGYATAFIDRMDIDLDNKIDLDAGTF